MDQYYLFVTKAHERDTRELSPEQMQRHEQQEELSRHAREEALEGRVKYGR